MPPRLLPLLVVMFLVASSTAPAQAPAPRPAAEIQLDRLLGDDAAASREEACQMGHEGKPALVRLEARLAAMETVTPAQKERAASVLAVALLYTVPRAELEAWPVLAEIARPWEDKGREICKRLAAWEGKFRGRGNTENWDEEVKPEPAVLDKAALFRLQGLALAGIADLCASDSALNRAFGVSLVFSLNAVAAQALIDQVERAGGEFESFDGCCLHHNGVQAFVALRKKDASLWRARADKGGVLDRVAFEAELMAGSLQCFCSPDSDPTIDLINALRQAGEMAAWNARTREEWWIAARPVWAAYWNEFAGKAGKTREEWQARLKAIGDRK